MSSILVILEDRNGSLTRHSTEAIAAAQQLAAQLDLFLHAAVLGSSPQQIAATIAQKNITRLKTIHAIEHTLLATYTADGFTLALQQLLQSTQPACVVLPHSYQVRDFAPRLATRFGQSLLSDVIAIHAGGNPGPITGGNPSPIFVRQLFQGKLSADFTLTGSTKFISIQAGAFPIESLETSTASAAEIKPFTPQLTAEQIRTTPGERFRESAATVDLSAATLIVSVGRGIGSAENIPLAQSLATALGADLAGSRPVCDNGWLPMERQVGSSGHTVAPRLYIALGISGAIQHLVGMKGAKTIVAINKDEHAPIFEVADYGIVGDLFEVIPALTEAVKNTKGT